MTLDGWSFGSVDLGRVEVVLCDVDGNLMPSEELAFVASAGVTNQFLAAHGITREYGAEELRLATTGLNFRSTAVRLALTHGVPVVAELPQDAADGDAERDGSLPELTTDELEAWVRREQNAVVAHLRATLQPDPVVLAALTELAARYRTAAVSSSADARIAACFEVTGLAEFFPADRRFSAEDSLPRPTSKPDPAIYRFACERLGIEPTQAVAVEDSVAGVTSAVRAGIPTVGNLQFVQAGERDERRRLLQDAGAGVLVESWSEVADLLRG